MKWSEANNRVLYDMRPIITSYIRIAAALVHAINLESTCVQEVE